MWGVFIFDEHVRSRLNASLAILVMMIGLWGMAYFSSPEAYCVNDNEAAPLDEPLLPRNEITPTYKWLTRRRIGLLCAVIDGVWGGSILVPMHFAK